VPPKWLCTKHLGGEHLEMHMFLGAVRKGSSLRGYIANGLVEVHNITRRHAELVKEMDARGWSHASPMNSTVILPIAGKVDVQKNIVDLMNRCPACKKRIEDAENICNTATHAG
jgi:hypothetical protein